MMPIAGIPFFKLRRIIPNSLKFVKDYFKPPVIHTTPSSYQQHANTAGNKGLTLAKMIATLYPMYAHILPPIVAIVQAAHGYMMLPPY
jgi:hypothetical protein